MTCVSTYVHIKCRCVILPIARAVTQIDATQHIIMAESKKRARALELISLGRKCYARHAGIAALLAHISAHGTPDTSSRKAQYDARKTITRTVTAYGPMVVEVDVPLAAGGTTKNRSKTQSHASCTNVNTQHTMPESSRRRLLNILAHLGRLGNSFCTRMVLIHRIWDQRIIRGNVVFLFVFRRIRAARFGSRRSLVHSLHC